MTDVFKWEFSVSDVAQGQIGKPPTITKGNPLLCECYCKRNMLEYTSCESVLVLAIIISISNSLQYNTQKSHFSSGENSNSNDVTQGLSVNPNISEV